MADPANTTLGRLLLDRITPVVMVLRTPLVEESCRKNGLSFVEMLTPFCSFNNIDVPVRTASDQPYRVRRFRLRLHYASEIRQPNVEVAKARLKQLIIHAADKHDSELCSDPPEIDTVTAASALDLVPSWFQIFDQELIDTVSFSEHEAFDHPVACLVVVSSKDKDPIDKFVDLFNTNQLPSLFNDGAMDPKILKYCLLVHDNQDGMSEKATGILTEMKSTFGVSNCRLLCMNSSVDGAEEHQEDPWASYKDTVSNNEHLGRFLNVDDIQELKNTMQDIASKHIIPHMELKVRVLNQQVSATRKGFRNQIKNLWWRKGKEDAPDNPNGPVYTFSSIESQIRLLGDYAFMLQDYELALSNYRLISTDYKLDKAWKRYAGVQEMMGLAYFLMDQSRKDAEYCMDNAFSTYLKIGSSGNATRSGLWWAEMLKARDQYKDAAGVYFRISGEEPLHAAVMLEQAAYCYLLSKPTMLRKYGFHLVLSGDLYRRCDQIKHAIRAYRGALSVLKGSAWSRVRDHVHFHIGKWYAFLGMLDEAIKHMLEVLACGHQSKSTQELYLREFFRIIQETGKIIQVSRLRLPVISFPLTQVVFEDHRTYASPAAASVRETLWRSLEEDMVPTLPVMKTNWLESQSKVLPKKYKESNVCVAGEAIKLDVAFKNPLQIPISISNVSLICEHSVESDHTESDASSSHDYQDKEQMAVSVSGDFSLETSLFTLSEVDISIKGGETKLVQLTVTPKVEGTLKVVGVRWKLSGSVVGIYIFHSDIGKKKFAKGKRKPIQMKKDNLKFLVIKSVPRLQGVIDNLPTTVYAGDVRRLTLELRNSSGMSVKNLKIRVSHPRLISVADQEVMDLEFPACLRKQENYAQSLKQEDATKAVNGVFVFPETTAISQDTPLKWPLWFRAAASGSYSLYLTIYYEMEDSSTVITYRTLRMHYKLEVLPSLEVSFKLSPCPSRLHEFLVRMDVTNRTSSQNFQIHQLSCVGDQRELLQSIEPSSPLELLTAGQALSCFFKLKKCRTQCTAKGDVSSLAAARTADVRLSHGDSGGFFDVSSSPLILYHHLERSHQEVAEQENQNTVDFILISESLSDSSPGSPHSAGFFSHHTCHYRIMSTSPIRWLLDGPRTVRHDFSTTFCEINLCMTVYNSSEEVVLVKVKTHDSAPSVLSVGGAASVSGNEVGWHDLSHLMDIKVTSDVMGTQRAKPPAPESVSPFVWSGLSSTHFNLEPYSSTKFPLQICVFSPGTYDVSNYSLHWNLLSSGDGGDDDGSRRSGTCQGHSCYISVLQKE